LSTSAWPAGRIRPSAVSRSMRSRLIFDQTLFARRGVNRCTYQWPSIRRTMPSIQPKQSATSTALVQSIDATPLPFLAIRTQTCVAVDALSTSQVSNALSSSKNTASSWTIDMTGTLRPGDP
jgi:hypothetical protein